MSLTYPDTIRPEPQPTVPEMMAREAAPSTPVYARGPVRRGKVRSWMILAPVGVLTVAAIGAWGLMNPAEETSAPTETAALTSAPVASAGNAPLLDAQTLETAAAREGLAADVATTAAPVAAEVQPAAAPAPRAAAPAAPAAAREPEPVTPAGPQPYETVVAADGEAGATTAAAAEAPAPLIVVEPN